MNHFLPSRFVEHGEWLVLGLEPLDAGRLTRIGPPFRITFDEIQLGLPRPPLERHDSCLYVLRYAPTLRSRVDLRCFDSRKRLYRPEDDRRRFVPRRFRILLLPTAPVNENEPPYLHQVRRPLLFPGAAYDVSATATGLRGQVRRDGRPVRWTRIEAKLPGNGVVVGRSQGDDRGEFLLLIQANASPVGELTNPLPIEVTVFAPTIAPAPAPADLPQRDPLWDLPLEQMPAPEAPDVVSTGEALPTGYAAKVTRPVDVILGKLRSDIAVFDLP